MLFATELLLLLLTPVLSMIPVVAVCFWLRPKLDG